MRMSTVDRFPLSSKSSLVTLRTEGDTGDGGGGTDGLANTGVGRDSSLLTAALQVLCNSQSLVEWQKSS